MYGCFSNFSRHSFEVNGKQYKTSEHYFQSKKFEGTSHEDDVINAPTAMECAKIGRDRNRPLRNDWEQIKDDIMREAIRFKFTNHEDIKEILLSTGEDELVEDSPIDYYWGIGADGTGKNMLGKLLMELRTDLKNRS